MRKSGGVIEPKRALFMQINRTVALEHVDGDLTLLAELASMFMKDYPRLVRELRRCIVEGDSVRVERNAHTLKGRLAFFGMEQEREFAMKLEMSGRQGKLAEARRLLADLEGRIQTALPEFAALAVPAGPSS